MAAVDARETKSITIDGVTKVYDSPRNVFMLYSDMNRDRIIKANENTLFTDVAKLITKEYYEAQKQNRLLEYEEASNELKTLSRRPRNKKKKRLTPQRRARNLKMLRDRLDKEGGALRIVNEMTIKEIKLVHTGLNGTGEPPKKRKAELIAELCDTEDKIKAVLDMRVQLIQHLLPDATADAQRKPLNTFLKRYAAEMERAGRVPIAETARSVLEELRKTELPLSYQDAVALLSMLPKSLEYAQYGVPVTPSTSASAGSDDATTSMEVEESAAPAPTPAPKKQRKPAAKKGAVKEQASPAEDALEAPPPIAQKTLPATTTVSVKIIEAGKKQRATKKPKQVEASDATKKPTTQVEEASDSAPVEIAKPSVGKKRKAATQSGAEAKKAKTS